MPVILIMHVLVAGCAGPPLREVPQLSYDELLDLADVHTRAGWRTDAIHVLEEAGFMELERYEAFVLLGEIRYGMGDLIQAESDLNRAISIESENPVILNNLAWIQLESGRPERALHTIERALDIGPVPVYPYLDTQTRVLLNLGRYEDALEIAHMTIDLIPDHDPKARQALEALVEEIEALRSMN